MKVVKTGTLLSSQAVGASAYTEGLYVGDSDELLVFFVMTAQGTYTDETLDIKLQTKDPDGNYYDISGAAFTQVSGDTGTTSEMKAVSTFGSVIRACIAVTGTTPAYTFSLKFYAKG